jgi:hypothetical protein
MESSKTGSCIRGLNQDSRCAQSLKVSSATHNVTPAQWAVQQPHEAWVFEDGYVLFSQLESAGGQYAGIFGPNFSMYDVYCQPAASDPPVPLIVQVEHQGELISALPEVKIRPLNTLDWIDLGTLPSHPDSIPDFSEHTVPPESIVIDAHKFAFQVALESRLSPIVQQGSKKVYSVRVATGHPPVWQVDDENSIVVNVNAPPDIFLFADDPDLANPSLSFGQVFQFSDMTTALTGVVSKPYERDLCLGSDNQDGTWTLTCETSGEVIVDAASQPGAPLGEEQRRGILLRFKNNLSEGDFTSVLDVLDREKNDGLRDRLVLNFELKALPICGDGVVGNDEQCDAGENSTPFCDADCVALDFAAVVDSVDSTQGIDVAHIPATNGVAVVWHEPGINALWFRSIEVGPASSEEAFISSAVLVSGSLPSGQHTHGRIAALTAGQIVVAWTQFDLDDHHIQVSAFTPSGGEVFANLKPYSDGYLEGLHSMPDVSVMDGTKGAVVWVDRWTPDGATVVNSRIALNILSLSQESFPSEPVVVTTDLGIEYSNPRVVRINENPSDPSRLFIVWQEKLLADSSTRIRYAVYDDGSGTLSTPPTLVDSGGANVLSHPDLVRTEGGKVAVVWERVDVSGPNGVDIALRLYDGALNELGAATLIGTNKSGNQLRPVVAATNGGGLLTLWQNENSESDGFDIYGRFGTSLANTEVWSSEAGPEVSFNQYKNGAQTHPAAVSLPAEGLFGLFWISQEGDPATTQVRLRVLKASSIQP